MRARCGGGILGNVDAGVAQTRAPNGGLDAWATTIVTSRMRFVQVNGFYDQLLDLTEARVAELSKTSFGTWIAEKRAEILDLLQACDQVSVLSRGTDLVCPKRGAHARRAERDGADPRTRCSGSGLARHAER